MVYLMVNYRTTYVVGSIFWLKCLQARIIVLTFPLLTEEKINLPCVA